MISEGSMLKWLGGTVGAGGALFALAEAAPPDPTTMMYSLAAAVIAFAGYVVKQKQDAKANEEHEPGSRPKKVSNNMLLDALENFAYGPSGVNSQMGKLDQTVKELTGEIRSFRETTIGTLADHHARIRSIEGRGGMTEGRR